LESIMKDQVLEPVVVRSRARLTPRLRGALASAVSGAPALLSAFLGAAVLLATAAASAGPISPPGAGDASTQEQVAVFSGAYVDGVPVYRLPRMTVFASRPTELARNERQGQPVRSKDARARAAAKPTALQRVVRGAAISS
jgi:hypothetical protein